MCVYLFFEDFEEQAVLIKVLDVNDEIPEFMNVPKPFLATVAIDAAMGTSVYQLIAYDADQDSAVRYIMETGQLVTMLLCVGYNSVLMYKSYIYDIFGKVTVGKL